MYIIVVEIGVLVIRLVEMQQDNKNTPNFTQTTNSTTHASHKQKKMSQPEIESEANAWEALMLPLLRILAGVFFYP